MTTDQELASAVQLHQAGDRAKAEAIYRQILAREPNNGHALHLLGVIALQNGRNEEAVELIRRAIANGPDWADFHFNLGSSLAGLRRWDEAAAEFRRALQIQPRVAQTFLSLGNVLSIQRKLDEAADAYRHAIDVRSNFAEAHNNLGNVLRELGRLGDAVDAYREALRHRPDFSAAEFNLAATYEAEGNARQAIAIYSRLVNRFPDDFLSQNALGAALGGQWQLDDAEAALRQALRLRPMSAEALNNLGAVLKEMGRIEEALDCFRRAIDVAPDALVPHENYLLMIHYSDQFDGPRILAEMKKWDQRHARPLKKLDPPPTLSRASGRRLRVGYVSPDFADHVVGRNLFPLFREHDREAFEVFAYSNLRRPDRITEQFRTHSDQWRDVSRLSDDALARQIRDDGIDILVDLAGHTHRNRLLVFARRAAPVQVTFGGYPGGTGLAEMDYHLTDQYLDPPGMTEIHYVEKLIRMPDSFWCYDREAMGLEDGPPVGALPAETTGFVTFGCLNNLGKITPNTLQRWSKVLNRVPNSRMLLLAPEGLFRGRIIEQLRVDPSRVSFIPRITRLEYLAAHNRIDVALDSLPYGCHTTGLDCLWMSVPIVTQIGGTACGRAVFSHLSNLKLTELAVPSDDEFVELAVRLAGDLDRLRELRGEIRQRMLDSPLMDAKRFARNVENAFLEMAAGAR